MPSPMMRMTFGAAASSAVATPCDKSPSRHTTTASLFIRVDSVPGRQKSVMIRVLEHLRREVVAVLDADVDDLVLSSGVFTSGVAASPGHEPRTDESRECRHVERRIARPDLRGQRRVDFDGVTLDELANCRVVAR